MDLDGLVDDHPVGDLVYLLNPVASRINWTFPSVKLVDAKIGYPSLCSCLVS